MQYCFGIDIGGTSVKIGLLDRKGNLLKKWEIHSRTEQEGAEILPDISESLSGFLKEENIDLQQVLGMGIGVPAPVRADGIVENTVNLGWKYKEVKKEMEQRTGIRTIVGNDANLAALGEMWKGAGNQEKNLLMVTLGTGVGGGLIVDGVPATGSNGAAGEIGHICMNPLEQETCGCGNHGCLEQYASATGIARLARRKLGTELTAKDVFDGVKAGDALCEEIAEEFGRYLGTGLSMVTAVTDPSVIVIGGGVSKAGDILLDYIRGPYREHAFQKAKNVRFAIASLGNDAGIYGAAKLMLQELDAKQEKMIEQVAATMAVENMTLSPDCYKNLRAMASGEKTREQITQEITEKYKKKTEAEHRITERKRDITE
ncbi:glucokinase [Mediterraneibacter butyricigenes]|uniref:Glucokinase n=1 Tax=Mediterraneibacter butyricigenes TaxID=2316025 RepID=A0A391P5Q8_9FIRM|nr:glucokinase [Mediterraneibacter butyricigenes]